MLSGIAMPSTASGGHCPSASTVVQARWRLRTHCEHEHGGAAGVFGLLLVIASSRGTPFSGCKQWLRCAIRPCVERLTPGPGLRQEGQSNAALFLFGIARYVTPAPTNTNVQSARPGGPLTPWPAAPLPFPEPIRGAPAALGDGPELHPDWRPARPCGPMARTLLLQRAWPAVRRYGPGRCASGPHGRHAGPSTRCICPPRTPAGTGGACPGKNATHNVKA